MKNKLVVSAALILAASVASNANASTYDFTFAAPGVSGAVTLTYGASTDAKYPQAFEVTGISGTFSDSNNGLAIINAPIVGLEPIKHDKPEPLNTAAPADFSKFAVASGLPPTSNGFVTYDNLFYPGGSPATAVDYTAHGGFLDIYGLLFDVGGGQVVNFWSNGTFAPNAAGPIGYGVSVSTSNKSWDYSDASITPEPGEIGLLGAGLLSMLVWRRRASRLKS